MKIIVDEMPTSPFDCAFSKISSGGNYICNFTTCTICDDVDECDYLQAITDFHAVEHVGNNIARMIPIE